MYTLKELCERWGKTENDIFRMAANEEIVLSFWWNGGHVMELIDLDPPITSPLYDILRKTSRYISTPLDMFNYFIKGQEMVAISGIHVDGRKWGFLAGETVHHGFLKVKVSKTDLIYLPEQNPHLPPPGLATSVVVPEKGQLHPEKPTMPREPEKPLRTLKAIAEYCHVHEDTIKTWRKDESFPASSGGGSVTVLPSELNAWMVARGKEKKT
jgi:hypothetical protein